MKMEMDQKSTEKPRKAELKSSRTVVQSNNISDLTL